jgi:hypothetical protein
MKLWKWIEGRQQGTKYKKFPLWFFRIGRYGFDAYILKYEPNTLLDWHTDPVKNGKHWRKNISLKGFSTFCIKVNGKVRCGWTDYPWFRPDLCPHMVQTYMTPVTKLSIGFVKFNKK